MFNNRTPNPFITRSPLLKDPSLHSSPQGHFFRMINRSSDHISNVPFISDSEFKSLSQITCCTGKDSNSIESVPNECSANSNNLTQICSNESEESSCRSIIAMPVETNKPESSNSQMVELTALMLFGSYNEFLTRLATFELTTLQEKILKLFIRRFLFASSIKKRRRQIDDILNSDIRSACKRIKEEDLLNKARHQRTNIVVRSLFPQIMKELKVYKFILNGRQLWHDQLSRERIKQILNTTEKMEEFIALLDCHVFRQELLKKSENQFKRLFLKWLEASDAEELIDLERGCGLKMRIGILPCDIDIGFKSLKSIVK